MAWCITKQAEEKLLKALKEQGDPYKLFAMGPKGRRDFFAKYVGEENARNINALYESKLLLKDQIRGMKSFIKKLSGSTVVKRDLVSKVERINKALSEKEFEQHLEDYTAKALGFSVTDKQFKKITDLSNKVAEKKEAGNIEEMSKLSQEGDKLLREDKEKNDKIREYGRAFIELDDYATELRQQARKMTFKEMIRDPIGTTIKGVGTMTDASKASKASMDLSAILHQGFPILANFRTAPIWARNAIGSLINVIKIFGGKPVWNELRADLVSRQNYINGLYKDYRVAVDVVEEDFPTEILTKLADVKTGNLALDMITLPIQIIGKAYKGSQIAFGAFQLKNRADTMDMFFGLAEKEEKTLKNSKDLEGLGKLVNSLTARGHLGKFEPVGNLINAPFFSLRKQVATVDSLLAYQVGKKSRWVRREAALAALQQIIITATILAIANALKPDSVEEDSTSADFGKIVVGDTRFDVTRGQAGYVTLAMRLLTSKFKSSTSDNITELNAGGFGSKNKVDLIGDFVQNKLSPFANQLFAVLNQQTRERQKPTTMGVIKNLYIPLIFENIQETLDNPNAANIIITSITDFLGVFTNTYPNSNIKSQLFPEDTKIEQNSFVDGLVLYAKAVRTDPETAFNRFFTGQKIIQVSDGGIIVVKRQSVQDSEAYKKAKWGKDTKEVRLDHTIPNKLGGEEKPSNWKVVPKWLWSEYTSVENALIRAVKAKKISLKKAQGLVVKYKGIKETKKRKAYGKYIKETIK